MEKPIEPLFAQDPKVPHSIQQYASRMFVNEGGEQFIQTALFDGHGAAIEILKNDADLDSYLASQVKKIDDKDSGISQDIRRSRSCFCILAPTHGWGRIPITEQNMRRLEEHFCCSLFLYKYLSCFGVKGFPQDEGFSGFDVRFEKDAAGTLSRIELCYLLKYVELKDNGFENTNNPWSIRHSLNYQSTLTLDSHSDAILVRPSLHACKGLKTLSKLNVAEQQTLTQHWTQIHLLFFDQLAEHWRLYINYLDQETEVLFDKMNFVEVEPRQAPDITFISDSVQDMKRLNYVTDQALRTLLNLELNMELIRLFLDASAKARSLQPPDMTSYYDGFDHCLVSELSAHKFSKMTVSILIERQKVHSQELRDLIALRNTEVNKQMASSANQGTEAIVTLSENASQEARVVKVLTVLAVIFVPASFVADFMQMGFITIAQGDGLKVAVEKGLWFYAILTMPLVIITVAIYAIFELSNRRRQRNSLSRP